MQKEKQFRPDLREKEVSKVNTVSPKITDEIPIGLKSVQETNTIYKADEDTLPKSKNLTIDIKNELLKGFIYSEILSEPKSIRNSKRSM